MKIVNVRVLKEAKESEIVDSFTHDGQDYDLTKLKGLVKDTEVEDMDVSDLRWVLDDTEIQKSRLKTVNLEQPLLVTKLGKRWVAIDGAHRLTVAVDKQVETLPVKKVTQTELKQCLLK